MNAVGIDASKRKSMVALIRPFGEIVFTPLKIKHTTSGILSLIELSILLRYYEILTHQLSKANLSAGTISLSLSKTLIMISFA